MSTDFEDNLEWEVSDLHVAWTGLIEALGLADPKACTGRTDKGGSVGFSVRQDSLGSGSKSNYWVDVHIEYGSR